MQMGREVVDDQKQQHAAEKAHGSRRPRRHGPSLGRLQRRRDEAPHAGGDHDAGREAQKRLGEALGHAMAREQNERRPQGVPQKRHEERHEHACDQGIFHRCILSNFLDGFLTPSRNQA